MTENARGRDIIAQILGNMRSQTEELRYSRVVSSSYNVHLHAGDYERLEHIRALDVEGTLPRSGWPATVERYVVQGTKAREDSR